MSHQPTHAARAAARSFLYAFRGLRRAASQRNPRIEAAIAVAVITLGLWLRLDAGRWAVLALTMALVLSLEVMNSAVEGLVDLASPAWNDKAGRVKDLAAGAVLLAAIASVIVGLLVLGPPLVHKLLAQF